jgi:hypothetical protein
MYIISRIPNYINSKKQEKQNTNKEINMANKRSKKRNKLTQDSELAELAYRLHVNASRLSQTATHINIPAEFRMQLLRRVQSYINLARSLGGELDQPNEDAFITKESTERIAEGLGLFG